MRMHGWCETCHRFKQVKVSTRSLATSKVPSGICAACEKDEEDRRRGVVNRRG